MKKTLFQQVLGVASSAAVLSIPAAVAADVSWDNPGTGSFTVDTNWNTDVVPGNTDNAIIANGGTATITTGDEVAVSRLLIDNGTVTQNGGSTSTVPFGNFESPGAYAIGSAAGQTGTYNISGASALTGGRVRIGYSGGTGAVTIGNTSTYSGSDGQDTWVGNGAGSVGTLTMTGSAQWTISKDWLVVGRSEGTGTLTMSGDTQMTISGGGNIVFADGAGSTGNLNMSGSSKLSNPNGVNFVFGNSGTAVGNLSGNALVEIQNQVQIGNGSGANATLTISDNAVLRSNDDWLVVGRNGGTANVTLQSGTIERTGPSGGRHMIIADGGGANGTLTVNGGEVKSSSELWIGQNGTGKLVVNGGSVTAGSWIAVGRDGATASGTLEIHGGSVNKNGSGQFVLNGATSIVTQTGGALNVNSGETWLSEFNGKTATWTASGGTANLGTITRIGVNGNATMTISGTANYTNQTVYVGSNGSSTGTLNLNGGTFTANFIEEGAGNGFINFNGGVVRAGAASDDFFADFEDGDLNVQAGGLIFNTNGNNVTITQALAGAGGLVKQGTGTLNLSSLGVAYLGDTVVEGGTLTIHTTFLADDSDVYLTAGSVLNLDFVAVDSINRLFIDGIMMAAGTWGGIASGADYETALIAGDGLLLVAVPEPAHYAMGVVVLLGLAIVARRRRCHA